jgi:hypothetical protein
MSAALAVGRGAFGRMTPDPLDRPMRHGVCSERRRGFRLPRPTATMTVGARAVAIGPRQPQGLSPAADGLAPGAIIAELERPLRRGERSAEEGGGTRRPVVEALWWPSATPSNSGFCRRFSPASPPRPAAVRPRITQLSRGW